MKKRRRAYRKIYEEHFGEIPKDSTGRAYDIHHIDGDYNNNDISNLQAMSIQEHYKLHLAQGDWGAAWACAKRLTIDPADKSNLISKLNLSRAARGIHWSQTASKLRIHPFQDLTFQKNLTRQSMSNGTHSCQQQWICEKCGTTGKHLVNYNRYHGPNCGTESKSKGKVWINNGVISKLIDKTSLTEMLNDGWVTGRGSGEITSKRLNAHGTSGRAMPYVRKTTRPYNKKIK